jgi:hypothetical protein
MSSAAKRPWNLKKPETVRRPQVSYGWPTKALPPDPRIALAKRIPIEEEVIRYGVKLKRRGDELVGPCPKCGGDDRFSINTKEQLWNCRGCEKGGDVIDLVQHMDDVLFMMAVEMLVGVPPAQAKPKSNGHAERVCNLRRTSAPGSTKTKTARPI